MRNKLMIAILGALTTVAGGAFGYTNSVTYSGQGLIAESEQSWALRTELCGVANGADVDGPYLLWVLTATGSANADITINGTLYPMTKTGNGTFKYVSAWLDPNTLVGKVVATYDGR